MFLQKAHTKLCLQVDKTGKIPVKKWVAIDCLAIYPPQPYNIAQALKLLEASAAGIAFKAAQKLVK